LRTLARLGAGAFVTSVAANAAGIETGAQQQIEPAPAPAPAPRRAPPPPAKASEPASTEASGGLGLTGRERKDAPAESADGGPHAFDDRWWLAAMLGYASDVYQGGIGIRGGKSLDNHLYIGGSFVYHFGESTSYSQINPTTGLPVAVSASTTAFYTGPEVGYDFDLKAVVLRAYGGLGIASITNSMSSNVQGVFSYSTSSTRFVVWPGCTVNWTIPRSNFFVGGDLRVVSVPDIAFSVFGFGGLYFGS
jgi:hypothetical protein